MRGARVAFVLAIAALAIYQVALLGLAGHAVAIGSATLAERFAPYSPGAAAFAASDALQSGRSADAERLATLSLAQSPLTVEGISALALVRERQARGADTLALMDLAAAGGWWDARTQFWVAMRAAEDGNFDVAAQRADALLRQGKYRDRVFPLLRAMATEPEGVKALAARLEENPKWRDPFLRDVSGLDPSYFTEHEQIMAGLAASDSPPTLREFAAYVGRLVQARQYGRALAIWMGAAKRPSAPVQDGYFTDAFARKPGDAVVPFAWSIEDGAGAKAEIEVPPQPLDGPALHIAMDVGAVGVLARQMLVLRPGRYRLSVATQVEQGEPLMDLRWSIRCAEPDLPSSHAEPVLDRGEKSWQRVSVLVEVQPGCAAQLLELTAVGRSPSRSEIWYDRVTIDPVAG